MSKNSTKGKGRPARLASRCLALEALVSRERTHVVRRLSKTLAHDDAEDLYQEACLRALERLGQQRQPTRFRAWFNTVLRTVVSGRTGSPLALPASVARSGLATEAMLPSCRCGLDMLESLPERQRRLLSRSVLEDCSAPRLAREEGTTSNNIRVHLHRARTQLRARWKQKCGACLSSELGPGCTCNSIRDGICG